MKIAEKKDYEYLYYEMSTKGVTKNGHREVLQSQLRPFSRGTEKVCKITINAEKTGVAENNKTKPLQTARNTTSPFLAERKKFAK